MSAELQVSKTKLASHRVVDRAEKVLGEGEVRLSVEYFAFTANNITYGAAGDRLGYWQFFPVDNETGEDWGIIPVWGFADVAESNCADLPVGDRVYGYFPPAASVVMLPVNCKPHSFVDGAVHRQALPPLYNRYQRRELQQRGRCAAHVIVASASHLLLHLGPSQTAELVWCRAGYYRQCVI